MFRKILLPLDGSKRAEEALFWARQYAVPSKAQVVLLQVLHPEYPLQGRPFRAGSDAAQKYLQGIERELTFSGIPTKILLRNEPVSRTIVDVARRESCDLILMTSRGASKVVRWLIGGVAQQVMRLSPIPVLIVRSSVAPQVHQRPKRILVPQDGSLLARAVLPVAARLGRLHRASVLLLHVAPESSFPKNAARSFAAVRSLSRLASQLRDRGVKAALRLERGDPAERILDACRQADLLILTTHGYGGLKRLILGSVAEKIVNQAPAPVLVYKKQAKSRRLPSDLAALEMFKE